MKANHVAEASYVSLFSGAGGLDVGLEIAFPETRCVCYVEREGPAAGILAARIEEGTLADAPIWSDVRTFPSWLYRGRVAGIVGGFPCQDLSVAGTGAGINSGERSGLWWDFLDIVRATGPRWLFIENVPGLLGEPSGELEPDYSTDGGPTDWTFRNIDAVLGPLSELGFDAEWITIPASGVGANHGRKRVFILAYRDGPEAGHAWGGSSGSDTVGDSEHAERGASSQSQGRGEPGSDRQGETASSARHGSGILEHAESSAGTLHAGPGPEGRGTPDAGRGSGDVADTGDAGLSFAKLEIVPGTGRRGEGGATSERDQLLDDADDSRRTPAEPAAQPGGNAFDVASERLPVFAFGPKDERWADLLVWCPELRPSLSQAEAESLFRSMAHGLAAVVGDERTTALRALGNGVVPLQAAFAFVVLARRAIESGFRFL